MTRAIAGHRTGASLRALIGSGGRINLFLLPFLIVGLILNITYPSAFSVGGPPPALRAVSIVGLLAGIAIWAWSVALILSRVPRGVLMTSGPYAVVKHPLYTAVALLVLPSIGFLADSWLGAALGIVMYAGSRVFARAEEAYQAKAHGQAWTDYTKAVKIPWL